MQVLEDAVAEGFGDNHTVLIKKDTIVGIHCIADGLKAAEAGVVFLNASVLQQVSEDGFCGCFLCEKGLGYC